MNRFSAVRIGLALLLVFSLLQCVLSSLMGVDLGLSYIKVSVARPGKGLHIVLNEQSKRKTPSAVAFAGDGERLFGDDAVAYAGKAPHRSILDGRSLLGECSPNSDAVDYLNCTRSAVSIDGRDLNGEQIVAMLLAMARRQATSAADGTSIKDIVVTVPVWFDERHRTAVMDAARVIGLNCLAVVNANTAAAVKYALDGKATTADRDVSSSSSVSSSSKLSSDSGSGKKSSKSSQGTPGKAKKRGVKTVMFVDYGASGSTASIAQIFNDPKTGTATAVRMLGHSWERDVGGRALDDILVSRMASEFDKQRGGGAQPAKSLPRVVARLRKEAQRVREILSANTETIVNVPSLHDDIDFKFRATRQEFEEAASDLFARAVHPAETVLASTGLSVEDLDAVVPFGGVSRTPKFQEILCAKLKRAGLNKSINSDEAAAMGTAFFAASLSKSVHVRKMEIEDAYSKVLSAEVEKDAESRSLFSGAKAKANVQKVVIFSNGAAKLPSKRTLNFKRSNDFNVTFYLEADTRDATRFPGRTHYGTATISGASEVLKKIRNKNRRKPVVPQISLSVEIDRSGFLRIGHAESSVDEVIEVVREVPVVEDAKDASTTEKTTTTDINGKNESPSSSSSNLNMEADKNSAESTSSESDISKNGTNEDAGKNQRRKARTKKEKSSQKLVHRQALTVVFSTAPGSILSLGMDVEEIQSMKASLNELERADLERQERSEALNSLEAFIFEKRPLISNLDEDDNPFSMVGESERQGFLESLNKAEDWMYTDEAKQILKLRETSSRLQSTYSDLAARGREALNRPRVAESLRHLIGVTRERIASLRLSLKERGSKDLKPLDDLTATMDAAEKWLKAKEDAQQKLNFGDKPAFTVAELELKIKEIGASALALARTEPVGVEKQDGETSQGSSRESTNQSAEKDTGVSSETASNMSGNGASEPFLGVDGGNAESDVSGRSEVHDEL